MTMVRNPQLTLHEREWLTEPPQPKHTGFTYRAIEKLATCRPPKSAHHSECLRLLRCDPDESSDNTPLPYRMWLEAGKHDPPFPEVVDAHYNSNVWRNFRKEYGFPADARPRRINDTIAAMYPLSLPPPSHVGPYTYAQFLRDTSVIKSSKIHKQVLDKSVKELEQFKRLKLRSDMRNPPLDMNGNIMPPINFKKHASRFVPPEIGEDGAPIRAKTSAPPGRLQMNLFPHCSARPKSNPYLWKLSYKLNNPQYEKVQQEIEMRKKLRQSV